MIFPPDGHPLTPRYAEVNYAWYRFAMCTLWTSIAYGVAQGLAHAALGVPL